ncbi:MAG TPA: hypothetical protein VN644_19220 [Pyrinomonadaceae bacterium]|nr:hypothetical protein [Pyrinomonadaceae bacterium]
MIVGWYSFGLAKEFIVNLVRFVSTRRATDKRAAYPGRFGPDVYLQKEVETVMPVGGDTAGAGRP